MTFKKKKHYKIIRYFFKIKYSITYKAMDRTCHR